jgi:predicted oxidoreductase
VPLVETIQAFLALQRAGKIRHYGVSNLDLADMQELWSVPGGPAVATDQLRSAGVHHVILNLKYGARDAAEVLDEIGQEVLPQLDASQQTAQSERGREQALVGRAKPEKTEIAS